MKSILSILFFCSVAIVACQSEPGENKNPKEAATSMLEDPNIAKGKELFQSKCGACHHPIKDMTGPALKGVASRVPSKEWLYQWIKNPATLLEQKDAYATTLYEKWNKTAMTAYPTLTNEEIDLMLNYVEQYLVHSGN
jgi:mono/diheme cytochrome c family protein